MLAITYEAPKPKKGGGETKGFVQLTHIATGRSVRVYSRAQAEILLACEDERARVERACERLPRDVEPEAF